MFFVFRDIGSDLLGQQGSRVNKSTGQRVSGLTGQHGQQCSPSLLLTSNSNNDENWKLIQTSKNYYYYYVLDKAGVG